MVKLHRNTKVSILLLALATFLPTTAALAQRPVERSQIRPVFPEKATNPGSIGGTEPGGLFEDDDTELVSEVRSIILLPHDGSGNEKASESGRVEDHGAGAPEAVLKALERYLGHPASLRILNEMARTVVLTYRKSGRPVVDVFFPEQELTGGIIRIHAVEGVRGDVRVEGAKYSNVDYLSGNIRLGQGDVIDSNILNQDIDWLNRNPLRSVGLVFESGTETGTSDVVLAVKDTKPFHILTSVGNTGLETTGENELNAGFLWGHFLGTEGFLFYNASSDFDFENLLAHSVYWKSPFPWRHELELFGSYVDTSSDLSLGGTAIGSGGMTTQFGFGYVIPLKAVTRGERHEITLGMDYKSTNSDLEFGGSTVFNETAAILQIRGEYVVSSTDKLGRTTFELAGIYSPGNAIGNNDDPSFAAFNPGADPEYWYLRASLERSFDLPFGAKLHADTRGQWSDSRLLPSEQNLVGGYDSVRGFDEFLVRGDRGLIVNVQLDSPKIELPPIPGCNSVVGLTPFAFYDLGMTQTAEAFPGENFQRLQSYGLGTRVSLGKNLSAEAAYGWAFDHPGALTDVESGKFHFRIRARY